MPRRCVLRPVPNVARAAARRLRLRCLAIQGSLPADLLPVRNAPVMPARRGAR